MKVLVVDTSTDKIVIALYIDGQETYYIGANGCKKHNAELMNHIDKMLTQNDLSVRDIEYFGVCVGPGSFTGIRIGVSAINALGLALKRGIIEVTSLEYENDGTPSLILLPCGHGNFYAAKTDGDIEYLAINESELDQIALPRKYISESNPKKLLKSVMLKISEKQFVKQAKPFYLKKSSAERN